MIDAVPSALPGYSASGLRRSMSASRSWWSSHYLCPSRLVCGRVPNAFAPPICLPSRFASRRVHAPTWTVSSSPLRGWVARRFFSVRRSRSRFTLPKRVRLSWALSFPPSLLLPSFTNKLFRRAASGAATPHRRRTTGSTRSSRTIMS
jgi:uncharacterized Zn-finger protein